MTDQQTLPIEPSVAEHLSVSALEQLLWDAACVIPGANDAPRCFRICGWLEKEQHE